MKTLTLATAGAALLAALAAPIPAAAQIPGFYQLPKDDFIWRWGDENDQRRHGDFTARGGEGGFQCELVGEYSPARGFSPTAGRELEMQLQGRLDFIYAVSTVMNQLDFANDLDWAVLTCTRPKAKPSTEEEKAENEARAREKMQREVERRRARQQNAND